MLSLACSVGAGVAGLHAWPFPAENVFLALIQARQPAIYAGLSYMVRHRVVQHAAPDDQRRLLLPLHLRRAVGSADDVEPLPPYPAPETREELFLSSGSA